MGVKEDVKMLLAKEASTMTALAVKMSEKSGRVYTMKSISDKLARKTLRYDEFMLILNILGYEIEYKRKI